MSRRSRPSTGIRNACSSEAAKKKFGNAKQIDLPFSCSYDKLIVDEHVFIFNDQEKRVERLPYTVSGALAPPVRTRLN